MLLLSVVAGRTGSEMDRNLLIEERSDEEDGSCLVCWLGYRG